MITFNPLQESDLSLLLTWLEEPHVKVWWDQGIQWTSDLIREKYGSYVMGYKRDRGVNKPISAFIVSIDDVPVGYSQHYNAYDFSRDVPEGLRESLGGVDILIGHSDFVGKGLGLQILVQFLKTYVDVQYEACLVDPDSHNIAAINTYKKAGFSSIKPVKDERITWMVRERNQ